MFKPLNVLVACECSQTVANAFRSLGHNAFSCDIQDCYGGHPEYHIKGDALDALRTHIWDLVIAHPPCTYLSKAGGNLLYPKPGKIDMERYKKLLAARDFFMHFYYCDCPHVAIENPIPFKIAHLPHPDDVIQPFEFGHPFSKRTLLWLKNLPPLFPTKLLVRHKCWTNVKSSQRLRSQTFQGIADAMADQWSNFILQSDYGC